MPQIQFAGIDVSARRLVVQLRNRQGTIRQLDLPNTDVGHRQLCRELTKRGQQARVCLESTGLYSLDLSVALATTAGIELMVVNPKAARNFSNAFLNRSKTDAVDAEVLLEFVQRMPFQPWQPPGPTRMQLRALARRISSLTQMVVQEKNRLHAAEFDHVGHGVIRQDIQAHLRQLQNRLKKLEESAVDLIWGDLELRQALLHLTSVKGIGRTSAVQILAELCVLPSDLTDRQWVAHAGLDPRHHESGSSIYKPQRISRTGNPHLRAALYMPALTAVQFEPQVRAYYQRLLNRGKLPMQALVAVMRKLLHSIHAMLRDQVDFDGQKFFSLETHTP